MEGEVVIIQLVFTGHAALLCSIFHPPLLEGSQPPRFVHREDVPAVWPLLLRLGLSSLMRSIRGVNPVEECMDDIGGLWLRIQNLCQGVQAQRYATFFYGYRSQTSLYVLASLLMRLCTCVLPFPGDPYCRFEAFLNVQACVSPPSRHFIEHVSGW